MKPQGPRELVEAKAYEVSLVDLPANKQGFLVIKSVDLESKVALPFSEEKKQTVLSALEEKLNAVQHAIAVVSKSDYTEDHEAQADLVNSILLLAEDIGDQVEESQPEAAEAVEEAVEEDSTEVVEEEVPAVEEVIEASVSPESSIKDLVSSVREISFGDMEGETNEHLAQKADQIQAEYDKAFACKLSDNYRKMLHADLNDVLGRLGEAQVDTKKKLEKLIKDCRPVDEYMKQIQAAEERIKELEQQLSNMSEVLDTSKQVQDLMKSAYNESKRFPAPSAPTVDLHEDQPDQEVTKTDWSFD